MKEVADITPIVKEDVVSCDHGWWYPERREEDLFDIWKTSFNQLMPHRVLGKTGFGAPYKCLPCRIYPVKAEAVGREGATERRTGDER